MASSSPTIPSTLAPSPEAPLASDERPPLQTERPAASGQVLASDRSQAHLEAALAAASRSEESLSTLLRAVRDLSAGVSGAREANVQLVREMESLADMLAGANDRQLALRNRVVFLERALEKANAEASAERAYILDQQDTFIAGLMDDHEELVAELRKELEAARARPSQRPTPEPELEQELAAELATLRSELSLTRGDVEKLLHERERTRETLLKLQAQRDEAQAAVVKATRERDLARSQMSDSRISRGFSDAVKQALPGSSGSLPAAPTSSPRNEPVSDRRDAPTEPPPKRHSFTPPPASPRDALRPLSLDFAQRPTHPDEPLPEGLRQAVLPPSGNMPSVKPGGTTPSSDTPTIRPAAPDGAAESLAALGAKLTSSMPPLKMKPDPSTRPLIGYSITESEPEHVDTSRIVSRPPR
jgi:hypothetical protein